MNTPCPNCGETLTHVTCQACNLERTPFDPGATQNSDGTWNLPPEESWTIWVCDGCGAYGGVNELDRFGNHLVHHGESLHAQDCVRPARQVEVVARSLLDVRRWNR